MESEREYLHRRASEEQEAAQRSGSEKARELHMELATRYRDAAELRVAARPREPSKLLVTVQQRNASDRMAATGSRWRRQKSTKATAPTIADLRIRRPSTTGCIVPSRRASTTAANAAAAKIIHKIR